MVEVAKDFWGWLAARLVEPSSWIGLCSLATMIGVHFEPALQNQIITAGVAAGSLLAFILKEKAKVQ